jgi:Uma2 family endonuclease
MLSALADVGARHSVANSGVPHQQCDGRRSDLLSEVRHSLRADRGVLAAYGILESRIAAILIHWIESYLDEHPIGITAGESGPMRTTPGHVRMPDVSVVLGERLTADMLKQQKVLRLAPDLAIEVLSESNTKKEMARKLREYFDAGTRLVWYIDPEAETAQSISVEVRDDCRRQRD